MSNRSQDQRDCIEVVGLKSIPKVIVEKNIFEFCKERPAHWLQRLCLGILRKLGCHAHTDTVTVERHVIGKHGDKFMARLFKARNALESFNRQPSRLLIGSEEYAELMHEPISNYYFDFQARYFMGNGEGERTVLGLTVEVIPWMRGMLVMP